MLYKLRYKYERTYQYFGKLLLFNWGTAEELFYTHVEWNPCVKIV